MRTKREHSEHAVQGTADRLDDVFGLGRPRVEVPQEQVEVLAKEIADQLEAGHGSVVRMTASMENVDVWRRAARRAGRLLGVPVRTGVADDGSKVWVVEES